MEFQNDNIVNASERLIIHGCNAHGKMGSGVARSIRDRFPDAYETYKYFHDLGLLELGSVNYYHHPILDIFVGNCITQDEYGYDGKKYASYWALIKCLDNVANFCMIHNIDKVATPLIGTGLGGLNKQVVLELFKEFEEKYTTDQGISLVVYDIN